MKKIYFYKEQIVIAIVIVLFVGVSAVSLTSIKRLQGNARVVNYVGIVRGATQKLVKRELYKEYDDKLIDYLNSIVDGLIHGGGTFELIPLKDDDFQSHMSRVSIAWEDLKAEIMRVRNGAGNDRMYALSEDYFELVNETTFSAEKASEHYVKLSINVITGANIGFFLFLMFSLVYFMRAMALKRRTAALNQIAYIDPLTQMPNRARCEQQIDKYIRKRSAEGIAVLMFDMNGLKQTNDLIGHLGGDALIADFGRILKQEAADYGFVGRFGGDEFLALFCPSSSYMAEEYVQRVNEKVSARNVLQNTTEEKISFAVGYCVGNLGSYTLSQLIHEADSRMYAQKRKMKMEYK